MKKRLDYYLALPYKTEIEKMPEEENGGYIATCPLLALRGYGKTMDEAVDDLETLKKECLEEWIKEGASIPEPPRHAREASGKFVLRLPRTLHSVLREAARYEDISLNSYIVGLLIKGIENEQRLSMMDDAVSRIMQSNWQTQKHVVSWMESLIEKTKEGTHKYCVSPAGSDFIGVA